jgi:hypothetical protein
VPTSMTAKLWLPCRSRRCGKLNAALVNSEQREVI